MRRDWIILIICALVFVVSTGAYVDAQRTKNDARRGIVSVEEAVALPSRQPIAGVNVELTQYTAEELPAQLDNMAALGFYWVRQPIYWEQVETVEGEFDWSVYDPIIQAVAEHPNLEMVAVLDGSPTWARHPHAPEHPFAPPHSVQEFAEFARAFAERYRTEIDYYQIWDEPNIREHWGNLDPRPADYTALLQQAYRHIHAADNQATVIMAALAPNIETGPENLSDILFLHAVYDVGGQDAFDAVAGKPYGFSVSPDDPVNPNSLNLARLILLREEMVRRGDAHKPLWGSNFGWNALPKDWTGTPSIWGQVTPSQQIDWTHQAYFRAETEWAWVGGLIVQHWQPDAPADAPVQGFALAPRLEQWLGREPLTQNNNLTTGYYPANTPLAIYDGNWEFGDLGVDAVPILPDDPNFDGNHITVPFYGTDFALNLRRDDYLAYLTVTIDGEKPNLLPVNQQDKAYIVLTSEAREPSLDVIPVASGLDAGWHTAVITHHPAVGDDHWSIVGFVVTTQPDTSIQNLQKILAILVGLGALVAGALTVRRLSWYGVRPPSRQAVVDLGDWVLTFGASTIFIVGVVLSLDGMANFFLRRDPPAFVLTIASLSIAYYSPTIWLTLIGLILYVIVIFNRPLMGILSIIFWSIFFTATLDTHIRVITVIEVMLVIGLVVGVGKQLHEGTIALRMGKTRYAQFMAWLNNLRFNLTDTGLMAFGALAIVSLSWAELMPEAFRELRVMVLGPLALYILLRISNLKRHEWLRVVDMVIVGGVVIALVGLVNYITGDYVVETEEGSRRLIGVYGSPNSVALHLGRVLPFAVAYAFLTDGWRRILAAGATVIMGLAILLTQSVGAIILGVPVSLAIILIGWQGRRAFAPLAGLVVVGSVALIPLARFIPRLRNLLDFENSTTLFRLNLWRSSWELIQDQPLTGVGLDQFLYAYRSRYILPEAWADPDLSHPHNWVLDYWVRLGLLGVLVGIWLQVIFWRTALAAYRRTRHQDLPLFALVLGAMGSIGNFLAHGLVDSAYFAINLSYLFVVALAVVQHIATIITEESVES